MAQQDVAAILLIKILLKKQTLMRLTKILLFLFCGLAFTSYSQTQKNQVGKNPQRPNIIFILVDELRFDALGCTGHPFVKTPKYRSLG